MGVSATGRDLGVRAEVRKAYDASVEEIADATGCPSGSSRHPIAALCDHAIAWAESADLGGTSQGLADPPRGENKDLYYK